MTETLDQPAASLADHSRGGLLVVSNREPYSPVDTGEGGIVWNPAVGGLTAALDPVLHERGGTWVAWGEGQDALREIDLPPDAPAYRLVRLALSVEDVRLHYHGLSNRALWPMSHYFLGRARYLPEHWEGYERVNRLFADAAALAYRPGDTIWVHDYQLALVPAMIRERVPDARIGFFWHIPWPSSEVFRTLPWDRQVLEGVLGADLVGVHTSEYARHFRSCCRVVLGAESEGDTIFANERRVRVQAHPIGVEAGLLEQLAAEPAARELAARVREQVGTRILLGVDRLDYTKGIPERLEAFEAYLGKHPDAHGEVTLLQIAVPSREPIEAYRQLRERVEGLVGRINGRYGREGWAPVLYQYRGLAREELVAHYLAADAMLVTPLRDGLNLVAKEFAAVSRAGVLILSEFAGAAEDMPEAVIVNPYDHDGLANSIRAALELPLRDRVRRLGRLKARLHANDLRGWADGFLNALHSDRDHQDGNRGAGVAPAGA